jgi:hypothetical protein
MPSGTYIRTSKIRQKMSNSHKGQQAWNKGKKNLYPPWNKGKKGFNRWTEERKKNFSKSTKERYKKGFNPVLGKHWKLSEEIKKKAKLDGKGKWMTGKKQSIETIKKRILKISGKNHYNYFKDRTQLKKTENKMDNVQYKYWMLEVKKRDNWKCKLLSNECKGRLEAHHIFNWIDYPELRYILTNGITLCHAHHPRGRAEEKRMVPIFQELLTVSEE